MALAPRGGGMIPRSASSPRSRLMNFHNQSVRRAAHQGPRGSGFTVEFLAEQAKEQLGAALGQGAVVIRDASIGAVISSTDELKQKMRSFLDSHFTGSEMHGNNHRRVSNAAVQSVYYDDLDEKGQFASLIYSKFGFRDAGGFVDFLLLHIRGGTIRPRDGDWLRLPNVGEGGAWGAQSGFHRFSSSDIFFVQDKDDPNKLFQLRRYRKSGFGRNAGSTKLLATLVKSLRFEPKLQGLEAIMAQRGAIFDRHFDAEWQRMFGGYA